MPLAITEEEVRTRGIPYEVGVARVCGPAVLNLEGTIDYFIQNTSNYWTLAGAYKIAWLDAWNRMTR